MTERVWGVGIVCGTDGNESKKSLSRSGERIEESFEAVDIQEVRVDSEGRPPF